jgi:group I intron endonuclease
MIGIYKITSPSNKIYIGQSWNIEKRRKIYASCSCKLQPKLYNSFIKYGYENHIFEIVHELPIDVTQEILDNYEILYWQQYKDCEFEMINIKEPGLGGKHSQETKNKIGNIIRNNKERGKKISKSNKGISRGKGRKITWNIDYKKRGESISKTKKGKPLTQKHKDALKGIKKNKNQ